MPAGHVFAAVVTHGFHHGIDAAVAHAETFARHPAHKDFTRGRAVQRHVADEDVLLGLEGGTFRRINHEASAAQALAEVIVGVAFEFKRHALGHERAETLARAAGELKMNRVVGQTVRSPFFRDVAADDGADDAIERCGWAIGMNALASLDGRFANAEQAA